MIGPATEKTIETADGRTLIYFRYLNAEGTAWVRHGPFRECFPNGQTATEGHYEHGRESGLWKDYHPSGQLAAEGSYVDGAEDGWWHFWDEAGNEERAVHFLAGVESASWQAPEE